MTLKELNQECMESETSSSSVALPCPHASDKGSIGLSENDTVTPKKYYRVGILTYTASGLVTLFAWMLWGDFCFTIMETVINILPLKLKSLGAANLTMALVMTTLPGILNSTICPWVSFRSDRYRSRWGRRIPFILWTAPFLTLFLILLGYSEPIGHWVHQAFFRGSETIGPAAVVVFLIGVFMVGFEFFNMFVGSVYWYLFNDVVPEQYLGRFLGLFRVVSSLAGALYNFLLVPHAETHMKEIFLGAALLYFVGFGLMCLKVKEGEYPPPPENLDGRTGLWGGIKTFLVECFSLRYYWYMFGGNAFYSMSVGCIATFNYLFAKEIGLDLAQIGQIGGYALLVGMVLTYVSGILSDLYHPLRMMILALVAFVVFTPIRMIYLFYNFDPNIVYWLHVGTTLLYLPITTLYTAAHMPMYMRLLPKERFGQFCAANALIRSAGTIAGGLLAGGLIDLLKVYHHGDDFCYRYIPFWTWGFQVAALVCMLLLYRRWKQYGGMTNYIPPQIGSKKSE